MSISHKSSNTQVFHLMVYRRALHPELFELQGRRCFQHGDYEVECWIAPAAHIVRFHYGGQTLNEVVIENSDHLPELGLAYALPCLGEKDFELEVETDEKIGYVTTVQTELLTDNLFMATYREMLDYATETDALHHTWKPQDGDGAPSLSILDTQKYKKEFHIQSYHLMGTNGFVLRTQSIFEACD